MHRCRERQRRRIVVMRRNGDGFGFRGGAMYISSRMPPQFETSGLMMSAARARNIGRKSARV